MNLLQTFEAKQIKSASADKSFPQFDAGDTIRVDVLIVDGATERVQAYEGVVIKRKHRGIGSTFTVKKDSNGEGVERTFMLYSPRVQKITVVKRGKVRRAKIYYMRTRTGKSARIKERATKRPA